ncbi:iron-sulfur cluster assembly scaffold protein [Candidatus Pacearchaeota archaeon]|nr:iron-sulfur cluster assembly scaffold protein [Candidatus Pacearchaeota archaeon]
MSLEMYREYVLDLYKNPLNKGIIENPSHEFMKNNPLCGDEIKIQLVIKNNKIENLKFDGIGCAISMASASLLTEKLKNLTIEEAKNINKDDILELIKIPLSPVRIKCALLSLDVLRGALENARN